jgi:hypothetical protein
MNHHDARNAADKVIGPRDSSADMEGRRFADLTGSTLATVWRGQEQLRQRLLVANSSAASLRYIKGPASRGAGSARSPQVASGG